MNKTESEQPTVTFQMSLREEELQQKLKQKCQSNKNGYGNGHWTHLKGNYKRTGN